MSVSKCFGIRTHLKHPELKRMGCSLGRGSSWGCFSSASLSCPQGLSLGVPCSLVHWHHWVCSWPGEGRPGTTEKLLIRSQETWVYLSPVYQIQSHRKFINLWEYLMYQTKIKTLTLKITWGVGGRWGEIKHGKACKVCSKVRGL